MDISEKKTVLDDSASIYQKREEKSDRTKWKECKGFKAKWEHFKDYYLLKTLIICGVMGLVIYAAYEMLRPRKERMLYVAVLDGVMLNETTEQLQKEYEQYIGVDEEKQETLFDNTMMVSNGRDSASQQKFVAHVYAGEIDVLIAPESVIKAYAGVYLRPLSEQLPADLYSKLSDRFCYAIAEDSYGNKKDDTEQPYGVYVTDLVEIGPNCREYLVMAICGNSKNVKNAEEFVRFLLQKQDEKEVQRK